MQEIEVKILEINTPYITKKLESWGAKNVFDGEVDASYYDFSNGRLKENDLFLRLRKKGPIVELTLKEKVEHEEAKIMQEYEVNVTDFEIMQKILYGLGLLEIKVARKHRTSYLLNEVHFEFDTFPGIPTFLEIEASTMERVREYVQKLGFSMQDAKPWSGGDVIRYYEKNKKRNGCKK